MKILSTLLIGLVACTATAEVIVYHQKINQTKSGNGSVEKIELIGFTVIDTEGHVSFIKADPNRRRFSVTEGNRTIGGGVAVGGEKGVRAIVVGYKTGVGALVCKGRNVPTPVSPALTLNTPKALKVTGGGLSVNNGQNYLDDFKGVLVYNATDTTDFNLRSLTKDDAVVELTARFIGQGFAEE